MTTSVGNLVIINDPTPLDELANFVYKGAIGQFFKQITPLLPNA